MKKDLLSKNKKKPIKKNPKLIIPLSDFSVLSDDICVAGIDLSLTNSGVSIIGPDGIFCYSVPNVLKRGNDLSRIIRLVQIANQVIFLLKKHNVKEFCIENYAFSMQSRSVTALAELGGVIRTQIFCLFKKCPVIVSVNSARKFLLGKSSDLDKNIDSKKEVFDFFIKNKISSPKNFDESDSLALAFLVHYFFNRKEQVNDDYRNNLFSRIRENIFTKKGLK